MKYDTSSLKWWQKAYFWFTKDQWEWMAMKQCDIIREALPDNWQGRMRVYNACMSDYPKYLQIIMKQGHEGHLT